MSDIVSEREFQSHTPWCQSRKRLRFNSSVCNCAQSVTTRGSQAHEAEETQGSEGTRMEVPALQAPSARERLGDSVAPSELPEVGGSDTARPPPCAGCEAGLSVLMLDDAGTRTDISGRPGVPSHAVSDAWWACPRWRPATLTEPAYTARLQQIRDGHDRWARLAYPDPEKEFLLDHIDAQALALRTVQQERAELQVQVREVTVRLEVQRAERDAARMGLYSHLTGEHALAEPTYASLRADVARLTGERQGYESEADRLTTERIAAEQQLLALREGIEQLKQRVASHLFHIRQDITMNGSDVDLGPYMLMFKEDAALLAAIKET